jgi:hypothetical protein
MVKELPRLSLDSQAFHVAVEELRHAVDGGVGPREVQVPVPSRTRHGRGRHREPSDGAALQGDHPDLVAGSLQEISAIP